MLSSIILALSPFVVAVLTGATKRLPVFNNLSEGARIASVRFVAAFFAVASASIIFMLGGDPVMQTSVEELVLAFITFLGAVGGHELLKQK